MTSIKERYHELLALTQVYLFREYSLKGVQAANPETFHFFRKKMASTPSLIPVPQHKQNQQPLQPSASQSAVPLPPAPRNELSKPPSEKVLPPQAAAPVKTAAPLIDVAPPALVENKYPVKSSGSKEVVLTPLPSSSTQRDHREFWQLFQTQFPTTPLSEVVPADTLAKKIKNAWLNEQMIPPIIILSFHDGEKHLAFLKNIARAITLRLAPARVISAPKLEQEKQWEALLSSTGLRLVIASDYGLYMQPALMKNYREVPQQAKHYLNNIPLLLLSDLSLYLKEPQLKPLLWRAICNEFASAPNQPPA